MAIIQETILYLDDEEANLLAFRIIFSKNYRVFLANNPKDAIAILNENKIKIVITDQRMPDITGLEFISQQKDKFPDVIWMILTAYIDSDITMQAINQGGVYQFLSKPLKESEMTITFNNAIEKYNLKQQNINLLDELKEKNIELELSNKEYLSSISALKESETQLKQAQQIGHLGHWELDCQKNVLSWSDEVYRIFGLQPQEFKATYDDFIHHIHPDDKELVDSAYKEHINSKVPYSIEHRIKLKSGEIKYVIEKCTSVFDEKGEALRSLGTVLDITERKKVGEALKESEEKFRSLFENANDGIYLMNGTEIVDCNYRSLEIFGVTKDQVIGKTPADFSPEFQSNGLKSLDFQNKNIKKALIGEKIRFEWEHYHSKGNMIIVDVSLNKIRINNVDYVHAIVRDITEKKIAEQKLIESEKKFRNIFNSSTDGIIIADQNQNILAFNQTLLDALGFKEEKVRDKKITNFISPKDVQLIQERVKQLLQNKSVIPLELEIFNAAGETVPVEIKSKMIDYENKKVVISIIRDISERKEAERKILNAVIETEERAREQFAKDLHDGIGPLLSASKIYSKALQVCETEEEKNFTISKMQETIDEAIVSAQEISNNISPHILKKFGLKTAIESFYTKIRSTSKVNFNFTSMLDKRINEKIEISLYRISVELIHNTIKHAKAKNIIIQLNEENNEIHFNYIDDGKGFDFKQILSQSKGMGLSNIKSRIQSLDGSINMKSDSNIGFKVEIHIRL